MALTSRDETDLLLPLWRGLGEAPPLATFLERVRRRTGAENVAIYLRRAGGAATQLFAGRDIATEARAHGSREVVALDRIHYDRLRPGRVYAAAEFSDHDPAYRAEQQAQMARIGVADQRIVRLIAEDELDAWMAIARAGPCSASDSALLSALAPYVTEVLRALVREETRALAAAVGAEGLARSGTGWVLLDREARVIAAEAFTGIGVRGGERLRDLAPAAERALVAAAADPATAPPALLLREEPRIEALLRRPPAQAGFSLAAPALLLLLRLPRPGSTARTEAFARLHGLPRREAELAMALADGLAIAEAAAAMGLTLETARNYSKKIYARLGVRGSAELVSLVRGSSAELA